MTTISYTCFRGQSREPYLSKPIILSTQKQVVEYIHSLYDNFEYTRSSREPVDYIIVPENGCGSSDKSNLLRGEQITISELLKKYTTNKCKQKQPNCKFQNLSESQTKEIVTTHKVLFTEREQKNVKGEEKSRKKQKRKNNHEPMLTKYSINVQYDMLSEEDEKWKIVLHSASDF